MSIDNPQPQQIEEQTPAPEVVSQPQAAPVPETSRNQFQKVGDPKNKQFTGRATEAEYNRINAALVARKQPGNTYDIVRLCLDMMNYIEDDFLQTFKTK